MSQQKKKKKKLAWMSFKNFKGEIAKKLANLLELLYLYLFILEKFP